MKYHTDQSLDLSEPSFIALFSCYSNEKVKRRLDIKNKQNSVASSIVLEPSSVVLFSSDTNTRYVHRIMLEGLGSDPQVYFTQNHQPLILANEDQKKGMIQYKTQENREIGFKYPKNCHYTLSQSDF